GEGHCGIPRAKRRVQVCGRFDQGEGHRSGGAGEAERPGFRRRFFVLCLEGKWLEKDLRYIGE
ncbi:hypothetical protein NVQ87_07370, partial [Neisseria gonorrhoeae]